MQQEKEITASDQKGTTGGGHTVERPRRQGMLRPLKMRSSILQRRSGRHVAIPPKAQRRKDKGYAKYFASTMWMRAL